MTEWRNEHRAIAGKKASMNEVSKLAGRKAWRSMLPMVLLQPVRTTMASTSSS